MQHKLGNTIDVTVSIFDDATNLQGGILMLTPLYGVDGEVYAVANGPVSTGGFSCGCETDFEPAGVGALGCVPSITCADAPCSAVASCQHRRSCTLIRIELRHNRN